MEATAGACDLYKHPQACCAVASQFSDHFIEGQVREVIASFLSDCHVRPSNRPCLSLDLGSNNGWMSAYMLLLGSYVVSVEPAPDFTDALRATAKLNCWDSKLIVVQGFACSTGFWCPGVNGSSATFGHRAGGTPQGLNKRTPPSYRVLLRDLLFRIRPSGLPAQQGTAHFDLIKMDGDGPEGVWLAELARHVADGRITVRTITFEANSIRPKTMLRWQNELGYDCFRLDFADNRRFLTATGWDAYSPNGTFAALGRNGRTWARDALEEEWLMVRAMRHVWRIKSNLTLGEWTLLLSGTERKFTRAREVAQYVLTTERSLLVPRFGGEVHRSTAWQSSEFRPAGYGLD